MSFLPNIEPVESELNSSTTPLGAAGSFIGQAELQLEYASCAVRARSDVDGDLYLEVSPDGTNWDSSIPIKVFAGQTSLHTLAVSGKYFRVRYVNGASPQTEFRLSTIFHPFRTHGLVSRVRQPINDWTDVQLSRPASEWMFDMRRGRVRGNSPVFVSAENPAVGTTGEDIWASGGDYPFPQAEETLLVAAGGDANDDLAGTGAQSILVTGLDANLEPIEEQIDLAGASASLPTSLQFFRVLRADVIAVGTYGGSNVGAIEIQNSVSGDTLGVIAPGLGSTKLSMYTVRSGSELYLKSLYVQVDGNKTAEVRLYARSLAGDVLSPFGPREAILEIPGATGAITADLSLSRPIQAGSDIWVHAATSSGSSAIFVTMDGVLIDA